MILHSRLYTKETVSYWLPIYLINDTVNCLWIMDSQAYMSIILTSIIYQKTQIIVILFRFFISVIINANSILRLKRALRGYLFKKAFFKSINLRVLFYVLNV